MSKKKSIWVEVEENEKIDACLKRIQAKGYKVIGKKEEPLFIEVNGAYVPIRQLIKFNCIEDDN